MPGGKPLTDSGRGHTWKFSFQGVPSEAGEAPVTAEAGDSEEPLKARARALTQESWA